MFSFKFALYNAILLFLFESISGKGLRDHSKVGIVGGHRISISQVPFMASLRLNGTYHWCGGSIIHQKFILTAAHCIEKDIQYKVLVGTDLLDQGGQLYDVEKIIMHESYSTKTDDYDICIIKLTEPLVFGANVEKVALPQKDTKIKKRSMVTVTGWGNTRVNGTISNDLLQVKIPVLSTKLCQMAYLKAFRKISSRMFCAGANGRDSCQGDSGGPLIYQDQQLGVTSFGIGCGTMPGVYTRVPVLMPWINKTMNENL